MSRATNGERKYGRFKKTHAPPALRMADKTISLRLLSFQHHHGSSSFRWSGPSFAPSFLLIFLVFFVFRADVCLYMFQYPLCFYYRVDFFTTESISSLQNRFPYYGVDFFTTESISLLQSRFLYYRIDFFTTETGTRLKYAHRMRIGCA